MEDWWAMWGLECGPVEESQRRGQNVGEKAEVECVQSLLSIPIPLSSRFLCYQS